MMDCSDKVNIQDSEWNVLRTKEKPGDMLVFHKASTLSKASSSLPGKISMTQAA
jgi:hypothetical protein